MNSDDGRVQKIVGHLFRHEAGRMAAVLTRLLGFTNLETAEDIVQDTLLKAMNTWRIKGIPDNPSAWLYTAARNKAIDTLRKEKRLARERDRLMLHSEWTLAPSVSQLFLENEIEDSMLRMMFACCHPDIPEESQIALVLKTLCGLGTHEIANAFLTSEEVITKRLYRAKEKIRQEKIELEAPVSLELKARLNSVLKSLYLLFNEGYNSTHHESLIRQDICEEAMRLCLLLTKNSLTNLPTTNALLALMCFQASRFDTRIGHDGQIVLLKDQDRSKWNKELITTGQYYLEKSAADDEISDFHLEAALASCHALAKRFEDTNWKRIIQLYDMLLQVRANPITSLNRAIAIGYYQSPEAGIDELLKLTDLTENHYYHTALGDFYQMLDRNEDAIRCYESAADLTESSKEIQLLYRKANALR